MYTSTYWYCRLRRFRWLARNICLRLEPYDYSIRRHLHLLLPGVVSGTNRYMFPILTYSFPVPHPQSLEV